jgi:predicted outer membrane repeat protein
MPYVLLLPLLLLLLMQVTIRNSSLPGNMAQLGGALACEHNSTLTVNKASLSSNAAKHGGAIHAKDTCKVRAAGP